MYDDPCVSAATERVEAFVENASDGLDFRSLIAQLGTLTSGSLEDILRCTVDICSQPHSLCLVCYHVYDVDGDGLISRTELLHVLQAALQDKDESELLYIVMMIFRGSVY